LYYFIDIYLGLDLEMAFKHHYHEVLDTIGDMFTQIFRGLRDRYQVGSSAFTKTVLRIRDLYPDPGSRGQKGTGSRIRIRINARKYKFFLVFPLNRVGLPKNYYSEFFSFEYGSFSPLLC
jgi:hypothetical protein